MFKETVKALSEVDLPTLEDDALSKILNGDADLWICPITKRAFPSSETEKIAAHKKELVAEIRRRRDRADAANLRAQADEEFQKARNMLLRAKTLDDWVSCVKKAWVSFLKREIIHGSKSLSTFRIEPPEKYSDNLQIFLPKIYSSVELPCPLPLVILRCSPVEGADISPLELDFPRQFSSVIQTVRSISRIPSKHANLVKQELFCSLGAAGVPLASIDDMTLVNRADGLVDHIYSGRTGMSPVVKKLLKSAQFQRMDYTEIDPDGVLLPAGEKVNAARSALEKAGKDLAYAKRGLASKTISVMKAYHEENGTKVSY